MADDEKGSADYATGLLERRRDGTLVAVDAGYCELLGRARSELLGRSPTAFMDPDDAGRQPHSDPAYSQREERYMRGDGETRWLRVTEIWRPDLQRVLGHVVDITDSVRQHHAAQVSARRAKALVEHCADLILTVGPDGRLADANPAARKLLRWKSGDPAIEIITSVVHPEDAVAVSDALTSASRCQGLAPPITFRMRGPDGPWLHLSAIADNQLADPEINAMIVTTHEVTAEIEQLHQLDSYQRSLVAALSRAAEFRDPYTAGHQSEVANLANRIAVELGLPAADVEAITLGASIHDIGKIAVPAEILSRPGRLTTSEFDIVKTHCQIGREILGDTNLPPQVADIVLHHHERLDGSGYPDRLAGEQVTLAVRIVAVADVFDAMVSHRPYRPALGVIAARNELRGGSPDRYDPDVVAAVLTLTGRKRSAAHIPVPRTDRVRTDSSEPRRS